MSLVKNRHKKSLFAIKSFILLIVTLILGRYCLNFYDEPNHLMISLFAFSFCFMIFYAYQYLDQPSPIFGNESFSNFTSFMQQQYLPSALRVWTLFPLTAIFVIVSGLTLALPVGPLSDDGMILFMEGGCDWGESNVFFFSKLGLLISLNIAAIIAMRHRTYSLKSFSLHFILLSIMMLFWWNDVSCDTYYSHPQGNLSQMIFESLVLAFVLIQCVKIFNSQKPSLQLVAIIAVNLLYVTAFYIGLNFASHWTWSHSFISSALFIALAYLLNILTIKLYPPSRIHVNP